MLCNGSIVQELCLNFGTDSAAPGGGFHNPRLFFALLEFQNREGHKTLVKRHCSIGKPSKQDLAVHPPPHLTKPCCPDQWTSLPGATQQTYPNKAASGHGESCKHGKAGRLLATSPVGGLDTF